MIHSVQYRDLEFERVAIPFCSACGVPQTRWAPVGMPYIPQDAINAVFYLYASREDALAGRDPGGTGFIVAYQGTTFSKVAGDHFYGVTNWHVVCDGTKAYPVIRLNKKDGGIDIVDLDCADWEFLPGKYDVAVVPLTIDENIHDVSFISTFLFADNPSNPQLTHNRLGVGEDVFMIGLFVDHSGVTTNVPSARFGNISMLPNTRATIEQPTGYKGTSYVVDMHSRGGFSGSPVFVYRTFGSDLTAFWGDAFELLELEFDDLELEPSRMGSMSRGQTFSGRIRGRNGRIQTRRFLRLLGIHWGQFPEEWELKDKKRLKESRKDLIVDGAYVDGLSGMTCVIPAWQIMEILELPKLKSLREPVIDAAIDAHRFAPKPELANPPDDNPRHKEDFTSLLNAAAKTKPQDDQT